MRSLVVVALLAGASPAFAQDAQPEYTVTVDRSSLVAVVRGGQRHLSLTFQIKRTRDSSVVIDVPKSDIIVYEERKPVLELELFEPKAQALSVVLAMDISGSMARGNKLEEAKKAALAFLDKMDARADVGLILFDHEIKTAVPPARDPARQREHREELRKLINGATPQGGTAYLDATVKAASMLKGVPGRRAVIVMTDGMDTNSKASLNDAIAAGQENELPVYTIGIGQPGRNDPVTTVLVLDRSGSMLGRANATDTKTKIEAMKTAAKRFVDLMRKGARTTLLPFSGTVDTPEPFSADKEQLKDRIERLTPFGGTLIYDATYAGVETLMAGNLKGKVAVVALTDGRDEAPGSRHSDDAVIARAKEAKVPLYMLGLGTKEEINEDVMRKMADETKGEYYPAGSEKELLEVFERLSIQLHDDGIDEESLGRLAKETGGRYSHVSKLSELSFIYERLAEELQQTYRVRFKSRRSKDDGTARDIDVAIERGGKRVSNEGSVDDVARGIVVPQMSYLVYLGFLAGLLGLLAVPGRVRQMYKAFGG
jgi:VWFA-related protein